MKNKNGHIFYLIESKKEVFIINKHKKQFKNFVLIFYSKINRLINR